jgi:hypothetical protein
MVDALSNWEFWQENLLGTTKKSRWRMHGEGAVYVMRYVVSGDKNICVLKNLGLRRFYG